MKNIVILGCGFAGLEAALWLSKLDLQDSEVTVVSSSGNFIYTPSLIWLPVKRKALEDITFELEPVLSSRGVAFHQGEAVSIDTEARVIALRDGRNLNYDYLLIATGWRSKRDHINGSENVLFPCELPDTLKLTRAIDEMDGGSITFSVEGERPGPGAEFLGCIDIYLREKGIRDRFTLNLTDEKHKLMIHLGKEACVLVTENFESRGTKLYLGKKLVGAKPGVAILSDGTEMPSDLTCAVGKLEAPAILRSLDFASKDGFIPVNADLSSQAYENIFVAGDSADFGKQDVPKVGHIAIEQGRVAAINIQAALLGGERHLFDAKHAFAHFYVLSDYGETAVLARNLKLIAQGAYPSRLKDIIEHYYIYTHSLGVTWQLA